MSDLSAATVSGLQMYSKGNFSSSNLMTFICHRQSMERKILCSDMWGQVYPKSSFQGHNAFCLIIREYCREVPFMIVLYLYKFFQSAEHEFGIPLHSCTFSATRASSVPPEGRVFA